MRSNGQVVEGSSEKQGAEPSQAISFDKVEAVVPDGAYTLSNIYFQIDRHKMLKESVEEMDRLVSMLENNSKLRIHIEGHVCCITKGSDAFDVDTKEPKLSENRAKEVYEYLVKMGIDPSRLSYAGLGRSKPVIADERSMNDARKNMRVEFKVIEE